MDPKARWSVVAAVLAAGAVSCSSGGGGEPGPPIPQPSLFGICGSGGSDIWVVGEGGTIGRWNGHGWSEVSSGTTEALCGVWGSGPDDVWVVGVNGTILQGGP
jgi:hypothetical protein